MTRETVTLAGQVLDLLGGTPGLTDREITNTLRGKSAPQQPINITARQLAKRGLLFRRKREDGLIGNYLPDTSGSPHQAAPLSISHRDHHVTHEDVFAEDRLKAVLEQWLAADGWSTEIAWAKQRGVDIHARRSEERWLIEVKGIGSRPEMRVNYFIGILGETLQRMDDPAAKYSIALPDVPQFRNLWKRLPQLAKKRTGISVLFVSAEGKVIELED